MAAEGNKYLEEFSFLKQTLVDKVKSEKRVRVDDKDIEFTISSILKFIDMFNSLPREATTINGYLLSEVTIVNELASLIQPSSVRVDVSTYITKELVCKPVVSRDVVDNFSLSEWENLMSKFRGYFRKDGQLDRRSLQDLRKQVNLGDVISKSASYNEDGFEVHYNSEAFIPILLDISLDQFYESYYWNSDVQTIVEDYFSQCKFNL